MKFALIFALTSFFSVWAKSDVVPYGYHAVVEGALAALKAKSVPVDQLTLDPRVTQVNGTTVGFLKLKLRGQEVRLVQVPLEISGIVIPDKDFKNTVVTKVVHQNDITMLSPKNALLSPMTTVDLILLELEATKSSLEAVTKKTAPLRSVVGTFNKTYAKALLTKIGELKITRASHSITFNVADLITLEPKILVATLGQLVNEVSGNEGHTILETAQVELLKRAINYLELHIFANDPANVGTSEETIWAKRLLASVKEAIKESKSVKDAYANEMKRGSVNFAQKVSNLFTTLRLLEQGGIRMKHSISPLNLGASLYKVKTFVEAHQASVALTQDKLDRVFATTNDLAGQAIEELKKLQAHREALALKSVSETSLEYRNVIEQMRMIEFQYQELINLRQALSKLAIRK